MTGSISTLAHSGTVRIANATFGVLWRAGLAVLIALPLFVALPFLRNQIGSAPPNGFCAFRGMRHLPLDAPAPN